MSTAAVPRYPLGEYAYQGLWWATILLPALVVGLRVMTVPSGMTFFLIAVVGLPSIIVGQLIAWLLAWSYRRQQWRHWMGPIGAKLSFAYYGAWALLALALPESTPGPDAGSLLMRIFGGAVADGVSSVLLWVIPALYVAMLLAIIIEGRRAVRYWGAS